MSTPIAIFWFRRDLRLEDNAGLYHALKSEWPVLPLFIFDTNILDDLPNRQDARVSFIHQTIVELKQGLEKKGSTLEVAHGQPLAVWPQILKKYKVAAVFTNRDYEPYAKNRDAAVGQILAEKNIPFLTFKDQVIFESDEVLKDDGTPYTVFTPYSRKWKARLAAKPDASGRSFYLGAYPTERYFPNLLKIKSGEIPLLADLGFQTTDLEIPSKTVRQGLIRNYDQTRDFPALAGTSRLGLHFRFGTISIRKKAYAAGNLNATFLNELIWRDFYSQILAHFPQVVHQAFKPQYDRILWREAPDEFERWCNGQTGYALVAAGMRELNATGYMHNRVRMVTASFLTKHLLIDWRKGEAYFARKLLDFDLASNNGGWQWAAGCGTDAAPYFRIFNPASQAQKFDKEQVYIRKWVPEFGTKEYADPIVDHAFARQRCLETYKKALQTAGD